MNSKRTNKRINNPNNNQQIDSNGLKTMLSNNAENDDPHPNTINNNYSIINATELNLDLLPKKLKNVNTSRPIASSKNDSGAAAKSFDRNKAREHIAEQQRKRMLEKKAAGSDGQKDEIKKRLAALHQNSLKIVKKNIAKKQKDLAIQTETVDEVRGISEPKTSKTSENKLATPKKTSSSKLQTTNEAQNTEPAIDATPSKRGILRRKELFDGPPTTHSPARLDKTFINSLLETVKQRQSASDRQEANVDTHSEVTPPRIDDKMKLQVPQSELKSKALCRSLSKSRSKSWDRPSNSSSKRSGSMKIRNENKQNIPFWLRPTSAQTYPYNFIMAVRKKLESVTQPVLVDPIPRTDTPLARPKNSRNVHSSNFRENLEKAEESNVVHESSKAFLNMIDSIPGINSTNEKAEDEICEVNPPQSQSKAASGSDEFSTNFSSISLHITDRNTMSELSSIRSDQPNRTISPLKLSRHTDVASDDDDDTTISSAILSQNSPEKKSKPQTWIAVPLNTEAIKDLKIRSSNSNLSSQRTKETSRLHPFVNTERGDSDKNRLGNDLAQRSMVEMFETFSKNLSQVISVNERLHSALSTSFHGSNPSERQELRSLLHSDNKQQTRSESLSLRQQQTYSDPVYTTSFEATNDESIQEADGINSQTKTETDLPSKNNEGSEETVKDMTTTKTFSEDKTGSVVVTQTVTSRKTEILSNVPTSDAARNLDPEFRRYSTASIGSDIFAVFSQSDEENSLRAVNHVVSCEESFNYSSIGMIDQLINTEKQKSDHLSKLMKIREKSLIDRTKGQIAWLELQKQKYKEKGLTDRISAVKKKQRALLMHMAAERSNILKLSKLQQSPKSQRSSSKFKFQNFSAADVNVRRSSVGNELHNITQRSSAFRAYEINGTQGLEEILRKREDELQKRRVHVEHLIQWHQRLNREEDDLLEMERMLMAYSASTMDRPPRPINHNENSPPKSPRKAPQEIRKIKNIEKSLQLLHNMSSTSVTTNGEEIEDVVEASGNRLNKLWRRLTGENSDKFTAEQHYKLNKFDLEKMYEDAKNVVIVKFTKSKDIGPLNDLSLSVSVLQASTEPSIIVQENSQLVQPETDDLSNSSVIPSLDLNFSQESKSNSILDTNVEATEASEGNDNFYFNDGNKLQNTATEDIRKSTEIIDERPTIESDQDNTQADISLDNNTSPSEYSLNEFIDDISFPNLKDVTSLDQSTLHNTNEDNTADGSIDTIVQPPSSNDAIISDNVMAKEFNDNSLSDEYEQDNTTDKSLQLKNSSSDGESKTKSNQTMLSEREVSEQIVESNDSSSSSDEVKSNGLEQRLIDLDDSLKDLSEAIDRAPVMEISYAEQAKDDDGKCSIVNGDIEHADEEKIDYNEVKMVRNKNINESFPTSDMINAGKHDDLYHGTGKSASLIRDYVSPASELKMPDIISEAEVLRRHQLNIEQEIKNLDQTVQVVFPREIPNKPPPPYVPPAHGSPMNPIHPTDERIKEIVYRRISELYNIISDTKTVTDKSQSILSENITNVYERIILDVCKECITELDFDSSTTNSMKFKQRLAFYNPPNRLEYVQEFALKKVKKLLDPNHASLGTATQIGASVKRKRDLVDEMLVMEMIEDESKWSNFDLEEKEVIENIVEQIVLLVVNEAVDDAAIWRQSKPSVLKDVE